VRWRDTRAADLAMLRYFFVFAVAVAVALLGRLLYAHQSLPTSQQRTGRIESHLSQILRSQSRWEGKLERLAARLERLQKQQHAAPSHDDRPSVAKKGPTALADDECPGRLPFHTLMTAQSSVYQQWQSRIAYFHWRKNAAAGGRCTDMVGFTRLCATEGGKPDGLEREMPTIFTTQLSEEVIAKHFHFNVLNRPNSILQLLARADLREYLGSSYVLVMETDHVFMRPMPNLATETTPAAWVFGYMHANPSQDRIIRQYWPEGSSRSLDPVGPSPLLIHVDQLRTLAPKWMDFSLGLRATSEAESVMQGWVQEMWGYSIAAASLGIKHRLVHEMQIEASSLTRHVDADFDTKFYIFHYTYGIEYRLSDGEPQGINQIGEWSLDKRHYGNDHPPRLMEEPPPNANAAAFWLLRAWNEASAGIPDWPVSKSMGTVGWRREKVTSAEMGVSTAAQKVAGSRWGWGGDENRLEFRAGGTLGTPWGEGKWGVISSTSTRQAERTPKHSDGAAQSEDGVKQCTGCLFADFANANHNLRFDFTAEPPTFVAVRVGDLARVDGKYAGAL